jgi:hypothetical protein
VNWKDEDVDGDDKCWAGFAKGQCGLFKSTLPALVWSNIRVTFAGLHGVAIQEDGKLRDFHIQSFTYDFCRMFLLLFLARKLCLLVLKVEIMNIIALWDVMCYCGRLYLTNATLYPRIPQNKYAGRALALRKIWPLSSQSHLLRYWWAHHEITCNLWNSNFPYCTHKNSCFTLSWASQIFKINLNIFLPSISTSP